MMARRLKNRQVRSASTKPRWKTVTPSTPMAKEEITILADNHYGTASGSALRNMEARRSCEPYHSPDICQVCIRPLVLRHSFDPPLFDTEPARNTLNPRIQRIPLGEGRLRHRKVLGGVQLRVASLALHVGGFERIFAFQPHRRGSAKRASARSGAMRVSQGKKVDDEHDSRGRQSR